MKSLKYLMPAVLIAGAMTALLALLVLQTPKTVSGSSFPTAPAIGVATTSASFAVTTSTRVLATTTNTVGSGYTRAYAVICNPNANPVYLNLDGDRPANASNATYIIAAAAGYSTCFELTDQRIVYSNSITASSTNQTSTTITVKDYVY